MELVYILKYKIYFKTKVKNNSQIKNSKELTNVKYYQITLTATHTFKIAPLAGLFILRLPKRNINIKQFT